MLAHLERPTARAPGLRQIFSDFGLTYFANGLIGFIFSATGPSSGTTMNDSSK